MTGEFDDATSAAVQQYGIADGLLYSELADSLRTAASDSECKTRWVDQTPEYSSIFVVCETVSKRFIHPYRARRGFSRSLDAQFPSHRRHAFGAERRRSVQILAAHGQGMFEGRGSLRSAGGLSLALYGLSREPRVGSALVT